MYKVMKANNVNLTDTVYQIIETRVRPQKKAVNPEEKPMAEGMQADETLLTTDETPEYEPFLDELDRKKEIIDDAKQQADLIVRDAARRAQENYNEILQRAAEEAQALRQSAMEDGLTNGARAQVQNVSKSVEALELAVSKLEGQQAGFMAEYENSLKTLALEIATKILHKKVETDPAEMAELVKAAVSTVGGVKWVTVEVSNEMPALLETLTNTLQTAERGPKLEVHPIAAAFGTCYLDTPGGIVDVSLYTQIENLREYFTAEQTPDGEAAQGER